MKRVLAVLLLCYSSVGAAGGFIEQEDKQKHMALSAVGSVAIYTLADGKLSKTESFLAMLAIGFAKEVYDGNRNTMKEHAADMGADALGSMVVFSVPWD